MSRGFEEEGHNPTNCSAGHRVQREAGTIQVGGRANSVVVEPLPAAEGTLRAPRRHPSGVSQPRVCSDLLALPSTVMLGALSIGVHKGAQAAAALLIWRLATFYAIFVLGPLAAWSLHLARPTAAPHGNADGAS